jgi:integrase/recombinase XerD
LRKDSAFVTNAGPLAILWPPPHYSSDFFNIRGELPPPENPPFVCDIWPTLGDFRSWMHKHRGLAETTLDLYQGVLVGLLDALGDDARAYSVEAAARFHS